MVVAGAQTLGASFEVERVVNWPFIAVLVALDL